MFNLKFPVLITIILLSHYCFADSGKVLFPKFKAVIRAPQMRVIAQVNENPEKIQSIEFFASLPSEMTGAGREDKKPIFIGKDRIFPYEMIYNLNKIKDIEADINPFFMIRYSNGQVSSFIDQKRNKAISIDLKREKTPLLISNYQRQSIKVDGILSEWDFSDTNAIRMTSSCNQVACLSAWDKKHLYFGVRVSDPYLYANMEPQLKSWVPGYDSLMALWLSDNIEFNFDPQLTRVKNRRDGHREFIINPNRLGQGNRYDGVTEKVGIWGKDIKFAVKTAGTINDPGDLDSGYTLEVAIPWQALGIVPKIKKKIGFDLFNRDYVDVHSACLLTTWGCEPSENDNPSHWGFLVLEKQKSGLGLVLIFALSFTLIIGALVIIRKRKLKSAEPPLSRKEKLITIAIKFMEDNLNRSDLNLEQVAASINYKRAAFSKLFNEVQGESFPQTLNRMRMEKARSLLIDTNMQITEIAFEVGYKSLDHFSHVFKNTYNISPSDIRKNQ